VTAVLLQQDVLENDQIKLDSMFKFSLIQDIVRVIVTTCYSIIIAIARIAAEHGSFNCIRQVAPICTAPNTLGDFTFWIKFGLSLKFGLSERLIQK